MSRSEFDFDVIGGPAPRPPQRPTPAAPTAKPTPGTARTGSGEGK